MTALKEKDYLVYNRHELRQKPSLNSASIKTPDSLLVGKLATLLHSLILTGKTLYTNPEYLIDLIALRTHTTRTTARVYEDYGIIEHRVSGQDEGSVLNLSEGLYHHLVAMNVWRSFRFESVSAYIPRAIRCPAQSIQEIVLVKTEVDIETAKRRLTTRGLSRNWPSGLELDNILRKFAYYDQRLCDSDVAGIFKTFTVDTSKDLVCLANQVETLVANLLNLHRPSTEKST